MDMLVSRFPLILSTHFTAVPRRIHCAAPLVISHTLPLTFLFPIPACFLFLPDLVIRLMAHLTSPPQAVIPFNVKPRKQTLSRDYLPHLTQ